MPKNNSSGKASSTKQAQKNQNNKKTQSKRPKTPIGGVVRWTLAAVALFLLLTVILPDMGVVGTPVKQAFLKLFGAGYYYFIFLLIFLVIVWGKTEKEGWFAFRLMSCIMQFLFTLIVLHFVMTGNYADMGSYDIGKIATSTDLHEIGAGYAGGFIAMGLSYLISGIATFIFSLIGMVVSTPLMFGRTVGDIFRFIHGKIKESIDNYEPMEKEEELPPVTVVKPAKQKPAPEPERRKPEPEIRREDPLPVYEQPPVFEPELPAATAKPAAEEPKREAVPIHRPEPEKKQEPIPEPETVPDIIENAPAEEKPGYVFPPLSLLTEGEHDSVNPAEADVQKVSEKLVEILASFGVKVSVVGASCGPTITRYEVMPEAGVRMRTIAGLQDDLRLHLGAKNVRIEIVPGKAAVGIEIPNKTMSMVHLRDLLESDTFQKSKKPLLCALGKDISGKPVYMDFDDTIHVLVAGATGMGKSVCINSIIMSLLYRSSPEDVRFIMIDPKRLEFARYDGLPHLLVPVVVEPKKAAGTLGWACLEMDRRYTLMESTGTSKLSEYNTAVKGDPEKEHLPYIVIIIDELADLMMTAPDDVEKHIARLAAKARAAGIYLLIGTQRPSVDVITGTIKANMPTRISFAVKSQIDSRTVLDIGGAERLVGKGDMFYFPTGLSEPLRVQGAFVDGKTEVVSVCEFIRSAAKAEYDESVLAEIEQQALSCGKHSQKSDDGGDQTDGVDKDEPLIIKALELAFEQGTISTTMVQNRLELGYARAARVVGKLERRGYIGAFDSNLKKRPILITRDEFLTLKLNNADGGASDAAEQSTDSET